MKPNLFYLLMLICPTICNAQNFTLDSSSLEINANHLNVDLAGYSSLIRVSGLIIPLDTTKERNDKYGTYGTRTIITKDTFVIVGKDTVYYTSIDTIYKDSKGIKWEDGNTTIYKESLNKNTVQIKYNEKGKVMNIKTTQEDATGRITYFSETRHDANGRQIYGFRKQDPNGTNPGGTETWDKKTGQWVRDKSPDSSSEKSNYEVNPFMPNQFFIGFSVIREDSKPTSFFTYGGELDFNHFISQNIGLTVDLGLNVGSSMGIDYTKKIVLVGAYADIVNRAFKNQAGLDVNVHLLGGVSSITSSVAAFKFTSNVFTADLGFGAGIPLNNDGSFRLGINLDYIPTISGTIKNNIRGSAGLRFGIKSKHSHRVKTLDKPIKRAKID